VRKLQLLSRRLPAPSRVVQDAVCLVVPGLSFYLAGWRKIALVIFAGYTAALFVFLACLGLPAANWAFMILLSAHATSITQRMQPWMAERGLLTQIGVGILVFLGISLLVYVPARTWLEQHVALPMPTSKGTVLMNARARPESIRRGDTLAYRIEGSYRGGVQVQDGYGFGPVLAVAGDRVTFEERTFRVNGVAHPRLPHMPQAGEVVVAPKQWLVWPEVGVRMHGVAEDVAVQAMLKLAVVNEDQLVGKPFQRWFFRKQF
jgi:hypothetical protein